MRKSTPCLLEETQLVAGLGARGGGRDPGCCLSILASFACSSPPSLPPSACECQSAGTAGVGQSVNAADFYRRAPRYQRVSAGFVVVESSSRICQEGTKLRKALTPIGE